MPLRAFVSGASGLLGRELVAQLVERGVAVRALSRFHDAARKAVPTADWVGGDLRNPKFLSGALAGCDVVFHCAGVMAADARENGLVNRDATEFLLDEARRAGVRRFVHVSSVAVYGDGAQVRTREDAPRAAGNAYARSKLEAEDFVLGSAGALSTVVLRPCPIVGRGAGHLADGMAQLVAQRVVPLPGGADHRLAMVAAGDAARALIAAGLDRPDTAGAFNVAGADAPTLRQALAAAARALGLSPEWWEPGLDECAARNAEAASRGQGPVVPPALIAFAACERTYDSSRAREHLGFREERPILEALAAAVTART